MRCSLVYPSIFLSHVGRRRLEPKEGIMADVNIPIKFVLCSNPPLYIPRNLSKVTFLRNSYTPPYITRAWMLAYPLSQKCHIISNNGNINTRLTSDKRLRDLWVFRNVPTRARRLSVPVTRFKLHLSTRNWPKPLPNANSAAVRGC